MTTKIEYVINEDGSPGESWNPVTGCSHAGSPGCDNCWARELHNQRHKAFYRNGKRPAQYDQPFETIQFHPDRLSLPLRWRKPRTVAVCFGGDLFHEKVRWGQILLATRPAMLAAAYHQFLFLTKQIERMAEFWARWNDAEEDDYEPKLARGPEATRKAHKSARAHLFADMLEEMGDPPEGCAYPTYDWMQGMIMWPGTFRNFWHGVTCCNQPEVDAKVPHLLKIPGKKWLSLEPLLGEIDVAHSGWIRARRNNYGEVVPHERYYPGLKTLDWVVVGCESGANRRYVSLKAILSVVEQCKAAGVPCFVKQVPVPKIYALPVLLTLINSPIKNGKERTRLAEKWDRYCDKHGWRASKDPKEWPEALRVRQLPWLTKAPAHRKDAKNAKDGKGK